MIASSNSKDTRREEDASAALDNEDVPVVGFQPLSTSKVAIPNLTSKAISTAVPLHSDCMLVSHRRRQVLSGMLYREQYRGSSVRAGSRDYPQVRDDLLYAYTRELVHRSRVGLHHVRQAPGTLAIDLACSPVQDHARRHA